MLTLNWKAHVNELCNIDIKLESSCNIKLKSSCQWVMQCWHEVEKLMLINYAKLTLSWKANVNELCNVNIELKSSCQWAMQSWHWVEKFMSMSNINELS